MQSVKLRRHRSQIGSLQSFRRQHWGDQILVLTLHFVFVFISNWISFHILLNLFFLIFVSLFSDVVRAGAFREVSNGSGQLECHSWPIVSTPHHLFTLNSPQFIYWRGSITITIIYYWRGTITVGEVHSTPCFTLFTLHSINLSLTIILKRHTITSFHTELFTIHIIEKYQPRTTATTSFQAEFFKYYQIPKPPYEIFFTLNSLSLILGLKSSTLELKLLAWSAPPPKYQTNPNPNQPSTEKIIDGDIWYLAVKVQR